MSNLFLIIFLISVVFLTASLIKPTIFSRYIKGEMTRKRSGKIFGITIIVSFVLFTISADVPANINDVIKQSVVEDTQTIVKNVQESPVPGTDKAKTDVTLPHAKTDTKASPKPTPVLTQVKSIETISQKNAVRKAKSYLGYTAFSHDGLVDQLEYEQFSHTDAVYGADNSGANWNEQAAKKAKSYMEHSAFSRGGLIEQLRYEKFTQQQAEYGINAVGL